MADSDTTARGLLMLRPIPTFFTEDTSDIDWEDTTDMDLDTVTDSYYGKRSADAEAKPDPYYAAYGLGYAGHLGYAGLGYGHFGYAGLPYVYGK